MKLESIEAVLARCEEIEATQPAHEAMRDMCLVHADTPWTARLAALDPFSPAYVEAVRAFHAEVAGIDRYDPFVHERTPGVDARRAVTSPTPYHWGDSVTAGDFHLAWGWILKQMDVRAGARILEYGAGEGQLAIHLARLGCDVAVVDIDDDYLDAIRAQCESLRLSLRVQKGEFGDPVPGGPFDRIVFFEAFHHALAHPDVLARLHGLLAPQGQVVFAGEPIVAPDHPFVPFAWGPRLDGLSLRSMRRFGWCELGFQRPYFVERLLRSGFVVETRPCPVTGRGDTWLARPALDRVLEAGAPFLLEAESAPGGWHAPEGTHRWTRRTATLPVPDQAAWCELEMTNFLPVPRRATLDAGAAPTRITVAPGEVVSARVALGSARLTLRTAEDAADAGVEERDLGVAVRRIRFETGPRPPATRAPAPASR